MSADEIKAGDLGNYYFLNALSALASDPQTIFDLFVT